MRKGDLTGSVPHFLALWMMLVPAVATAGPATVLSASFETGEAQVWTLLRQYADIVAAGNSSFVGSNFDGVAGQRFMLFGMGTNPGKIRFEFVTVPGKSYTLSYSCGATDTQRLPIGSGPGYQVIFISAVQAYRGKKTVMDHYGYPVEIDDLENLDSRTHQFSMPGQWNWRIHSWLPVSYTFVAKSDMTRLEFDSNLTNGQASVGVLDQVLVTTDPFVQVSATAAGMKLDFTGKLQDSTDLIKWTDVMPQPVSPLIIPSDGGSRYFRVER